MKKNLAVMKRARNYWECELIYQTLSMEKELKNIKCPVLLMHGISDSLFTLEDGLEIKGLFGGET